MPADFREIRYAARRLRSSPLFTIAATATLALTIGAAASVFGVVDAVLLKAFPFRDPDRALAIMESNPQLDLPRFAVPAWTFLDWQAQARSFSVLAATRDRFATVSGSQEAERVYALSVTPGYFRTLGITPVLGRAWPHPWGQDLRRSRPQRLVGVTDSSALTSEVHMRKLSFSTVLVAGATLACSHPPVQTGATPSTAKTEVTPSPSAKATSSPIYVVDGVFVDASPANDTRKVDLLPAPTARANSAEPFYVVDGVFLDAPPVKDTKDVVPALTPTVKANSAEPLYVIDGVIVDAPPVTGTKDAVPNPTPTVRVNPVEPLYIIDGVFPDAPPAKNP